MLSVLLLLCIYFSWATMQEQHPMGPAGGKRLAGEIRERFEPGSHVLIVVRDTEQDHSFAEALQREMEYSGLVLVGRVEGTPRDAARALRQLSAERLRIDVIAGNHHTVDWEVFSNIPLDYPQYADVVVMQPDSYLWPNFLKQDNLLNITNQIAVIAIIAIGMTMVIITAGIDLSVGSLVALAAVVGALLIREYGGATAAGPSSMVWSCLAAIAVCALVGLFSGLMITLFEIPPFIVTLAMMLVASGAAYILSENQSIYQLPESFEWLGRGADLLGIPNAVVLTVLLYAGAHVLMTRTTLGRYIYAVGGNPEAARLSGVPVRRVLLFCYAASGLLAGLGGIVEASLLRSGSPKYGQMYELYVIAAVVVGGTSLSGGEGRILGTLVGALILAVIGNGMNLTGVEDNSQKVVLGLVVLGAVLIDKLKNNARVRRYVARALHLRGSAV